MATTRKPQSVQQPITSLIICFILWKILLLAVAWIGPGSGYDTSSTLLLAREGAGSDPNGGCPSFTTRLMSWDAIYFVSIAKTGYLYEQEWAFGWGYTNLLSSISKELNLTPGSIATYVWTGVAVSHVSHLLAVILLYLLARKLTPEGVEDHSAFVAAALHIVSPAGIILSAPYGEALYSLLSFAGTLLFVHAMCAFHGRQTLYQDSIIVIAGALFGFATTVRSNGIFNGAMIAFEFASQLINLPWNLSSLVLWRKIVALGLAGLLTAAGFVVPQMIAFYDICLDRPRVSWPRPWCGASLFPSVYTWVQDYYWGVGFFRYWNMSNLPLFVLSAPILWLLFTSAADSLMRVLHFSNRQAPPPRPVQSKENLASQNKSEHQSETSHALKTMVTAKLAIPQLIIAILALTNFHVQSIIRVSSGYPLWYVWLASELLQQKSDTIPEKSVGDTIVARRNSLFRHHIVVRGIITYAIVHAGLWSSFLPPA
ncbi:MAG: ER membrane glycoprotein subunit of the GPI transamidase complex-like protein [Bogoriella megaspora]|nr:MAG: ER membrane glycoprotein subunit of the GPI transamidase complex-like protein [Bogoriella megaspora]